MPNTDLTETTATDRAVPAEPKKSDAASRILRAVEKSRGETTARLQVLASANPSANTASSETVVQQPSELPKLVMPKIGIDAREALRSLSERQAQRGQTDGKDDGKEPDPKPETGKSTEKPSPFNNRTVSEILQATKPAVTAPLAGEAKFVEANVGKEAKPVVEPAPGVDTSFKPTKTTKAAKSGKIAADSAAPADKPTKEAKKSEPEAVASPARSSNAAFEAPLLGMGPNPSQSFWANLPVVVKAGLAVLVLGAVVGILFKFSGQNPRRGSSAQQQVRTSLVAAPMSGIGGWTANWGDPTKMHGRAISLFRPSLQHADYRIEFDAQIEAKAFGWVFRAKDPQNYYAYKLETVKPGLQPLVALARITVVSGVEGQKHYTLLETPVRPDTVFRVRMDSIGSEFTTRINDQLIEVWQDDRLRFGGVGLFSDPGERSQIRKVQIFEMR